MDNIKDDKYYLSKIIEDVEFVIEETLNMTEDDFSDNEVVNCAVSFKFIQISENASKLSNKFLDENNTIPWHKIKGLRNKIVHEYENIFID